MRLSNTLGAALCLSLSLALAGPAMAQSEPTIDQIYQAANGGRLADADRMIDQVLRQHPNSAKAHYVKAELAARESNAAVAREELAAAEKIAPGLPFAKPEAVQSLRREVNGSRRVAPSTSQDDRMPVAPVAAPARQIPMGTVAILFALVAAGLYWFVRRRSQAMAAGPAGPFVPAGPVPAPMEGGPGYAPGYGAGGYGAGGYGYPPPVQPGLGSTIGRGLATGLAVGAGAVAAEEIGRRLFEHHGQPASLQTGALPESERGMLDPGVNADMGGQDFGIQDPGSWDTGGGSDLGGGDWDN